MVQIKTVTQQDYNYRYDDLKLVYQINNGNQTEFRLKCRLLGNNDYEVYTTNDFKSSNSSDSDTLSLWSNYWFDSIDSDSIDFYNIESNTYRLQVSLIDNLSNKEFNSNKLVLDINRPNPDNTLIDNFVLSDINGYKYELVKLLERTDYVLIFGFATWCGWSRISIPQVNSVDSIFKRSLSVLGVEGSDPAPKADGLKRFVIDKSIDYPIFIREDNSVLNGILYPDNALFFPSFVLINSERREVYRQDGYLVDMIDSIDYYMNKN
jgi:hypothetical protein